MKIIIFFWFMLIATFIIEIFYLLNSKVATSISINFIIINEILLFSLSLSLLHFVIASWNAKINMKLLVILSVVYLIFSSVIIYTSGYAFLVIIVFVLLLALIIFKWE